MAYLTYLIDHYHSFPSTVTFLHSHRDGWPGGWHTDATGYDNVISLQTLNVSYVQDAGYANLRCLHIPGCPDEIQPFRDPLDPDRDAEHAMLEAWSFIFGHTSAVPRTIGAACCSQFAVSRTKSWHDPYRSTEGFANGSCRRLCQTMPVEECWNIFGISFLGAMLFSKSYNPPITGTMLTWSSCPPLYTCYCNVYGKC